MCRSRRQKHNWGFVGLSHWRLTVSSDTLFISLIIKRTCCELGEVFLSSPSSSLSLSLSHTHRHTHTHTHTHTDTHTHTQTHTHTHHSEGSGFHPTLQHDVVLSVEGLRRYIAGISLVTEPALNRCTCVHVQLSSSTWELESQTHTRSSLISGKERTEVPGRGKTDGYEFFCQLSVLPCSAPSQFGTKGEEGSCILRNVSYDESYGWGWHGALVA